VFQPRPISLVLRLAPFLVAGCLGVGALLLWQQPALMEYMLPSRFWLDANHFLFAAVVMAAGCLALMWEIKQGMSPSGSGRSLIRFLISVELAFSLGVACLAGILMVFNVPTFDILTRVLYTVFDFALLLVIVGATLTILGRVIGETGIRGTWPSACKEGMDG
jgi:hypothetical protein